jgi:CubicO group peptidase (beta-lactamase class C family)
MRRNFFQIAALIFILSFVSFAQTASLDDKLKEIDAYAQKVLTDWNAPGMAIAVVKDDKVVFAKGYGIRELGKPDKVDENTVFAIASNSKAFTAAALGILVDEKKIAWNDKVIKYLPEFQMYDPYVTSELTIRDLLSHRSGLATFSGDLLWYDTTYSTDEALRRVRYLKPTMGFRAGFGYQNLMFMAAGRIIEKVSGKTWGGFIKERIFDPLGMSRTSTSVKDIKDNFASPHNESHGGKMRTLPLGNIDGAIGAAGLNSSVADLSKWVRLQLGRGKFEGKQIFSEQRSWEMWQPNILNPISEAASKNNPTRHFAGYAMGWGLADYQGRKVISHSGGLDGMLSYTVLIPEENLGFVVLTNNETSAFAIMMNTMLDIFTGAPKRDRSAELLKQSQAGKDAAAAADKKVDESRIPNTKPTLALSSYAGTYSSQMYGDVTITEENGKLVLRMIPTTLSKSNGARQSRTISRAAGLPLPSTKTAKPKC